MKPLPCRMEMHSLALFFGSQAVSALCAPFFLRMILLLGLGIDRNCPSSASNSCIVLRNCTSFRLDARILASVDSSALASCLTSVPQTPLNPSRTFVPLPAVLLQRLAALWILSVSLFTMVSEYALPPPRCASCLNLRLTLSFSAISTGLHTKVSPLSANVFARDASFHLHLYYKTSPISCQ